MNWYLKYALYTTLFIGTSCTQATKQFPNEISSGSIDKTEPGETVVLIDDNNEYLSINQSEEEIYIAQASGISERRERLSSEVRRVRSSEMLVEATEEIDIKDNPSLPILIDNPSNAIEDQPTHSGPKPDTQPMAVNAMDIYSHVNVMPSFPGGETELKKWLKSNLKYPLMAIQNNIEGKVLVRFVVFSDGAIGSPEILRGVNPLLDQEALRIINSMPNWNPGKLEDTPVPVWKILPVVFNIQ